MVYGVMCILNTKYDGKIPTLGKCQLCVKSTLCVMLLLGLHSE